MSQMGLGRVKTFVSLGFWGLSRRPGGVGVGYALIAAISGRTPMMLITLVML
jgi:hypothetical protein